MTARRILKLAMKLAAEAPNERDTAERDDLVHRARGCWRAAQRLRRAAQRLKRWPTMTSRS